MFAYRVGVLNTRSILHLVIHPELQRLLVKPKFLLEVECVYFLLLSQALNLYISMLSFLTSIVPLSGFRLYSSLALMEFPGIVLSKFKPGLALLSFQNQTYTAPFR